jgi:tetratricopeptide (TPR) repeat protein
LKRELKRQIREDEFKTGVEHAVEWVRTHLEQVRLALVVAVVAGGILLGLSTFRTQRTRSSEAAFAAAIETFQTPVEGELAEGTERPSGPLFRTGEEKFTKAAAGFDGVARQWPSLPAGRRARYYAALCRIELGDLANAGSALADLVARRDEAPLEAALARMALADLDQRAGRIEKAIDAYRQMADDSTLPLPRDYALMRLGATLEDARRGEEAGASYRRLVEEFPQSVYAAEARRRMEHLQAGA